jgi:hypothetical protein
MYKVHNKEFKSQKEIKDYLTYVVKNNDNKIIEGDDFIIFNELIRFIPAYKDIRGEITEIVGVVKYDKLMRESYRLDFNIHRLKRGCKKTYEDKKDYTYTGSMVEYVPPVKQSTINYVFKFGKYKGMNIEDVDDMNYLYWITSEDSYFNKEDKVLIKKFIRYGFIPYNPIRTT